MVIKTEKGPAEAMLIPDAEHFNEQAKNIKNNSNHINDERIILSHDGIVDIGEGRSRKEMQWRNKPALVSALYARLSVTHRTAEKHDVYIAEKKTRQDEIKDVGGFVGGYINNGRRKSENIIHRQLITLDIDFAKGDIWDDFTMLYDCSAAIYSTHKHTPESPRLRLIIPLDRPVGTDEYIAIARRIADSLGINNFDDTTYEPSRLMYWPSTSRDGEFVFHYQDGPWLHADQVLSTYKNWQDASEWPVSDRVGEVIQREIKKQGDPLDKPGIVGAFCRTYNIHEAIETFLDSAYASCDMENRYTYKEGSTAAGLVVYDDKYAYSHHGTDPASGKLCNAFDLVRLHLYGLQDEDAKEGTPGNKLPSYTAMLELASKDPQVKKRIGVERLQESKEDFADMFEDEQGESINTDYLELLDVDRKGNIQGTANNHVLILDNDPALKGKLAINRFKNTKDVRGQLPWRDQGDFGPWRDTDNASLFIYLEKTYNISNEANLKRALKAIFDKNKFHPVRDYFSGLEWDKQKRVSSILIDYLGADDNKYVRAVTQKTLVAAVTRIFEPGAKWDYALIIVGEQGIGKSVILQKIGHLDKGWFSDNFYLRGTTQDTEQLQGVLIIEMGELAALSRRDVNEIKSFISRREDQCRLAYQEEKGYFPRQCVFIGTTNNQSFLKDATGNRRFWPVKVNPENKTKNLFKDLDEYEIDQIWAEAVYLYKAGEELYLSGEVANIAREVQEEHSERDEREGLIQNYLDTLLPENWKEMAPYDRRNYLTGNDLGPIGTITRNQVCVAEIWCECFGKDKALLDRRASNEIAEMMLKLKGWERVQKGGGVLDFKYYGRQKAYTRVGYTSPKSTPAKNGAIHQTPELYTSKN